MDEEKTKPGLLQKGKNLTSAIIRVAKRKIAGGRVLATDEEFEFRMTLCESNICGSLDEENASCIVCGCYLKEKLSLTTEECPLGFWASIEENENEM